MDINIPLLVEVKEAILANPNRVNMDKWFGCDIKGDFKTSSLEVFKHNKCGTTACIAGWAVFLGNPNNVDYTQFAAADLLGLDPPTSDKLFLSQYWPRKFYSLLYNAETPEEYAQAVADRIDHFIATEGRE